MAAAGDEGARRAFSRGVRLGVSFAVVGFLMLSVITVGGGIAAALTAASLMNARFLAMGVALAPSLPGGPLRRNRVRLQTPPRPHEDACQPCIDAHQIYNSKRREAGK